MKKHKLGSVPKLRNAKKDPVPIYDFEKTQKIADVCGHDVGDFIGKFEKRKSFRDVLRK